MPLAMLWRLTAFAILATLPALNARAGVEIDTPARAAIMIDYETGTVMFEKNADVPYPPASMTKLMTLELLFQKLKDGDLTLDSTFHVSQKAWETQGSKMFVMVDTDVRVEDLIRGISVQSGNDACIVVAEGIGGTEADFAELMTARGIELGLQETHFMNASGWPETGHESSARDLARLAAHIIRTYPEYMHFFSELSFTWSNITQSNRNPLLYANVGADGMKTGHTEEAGYGLVGTAMQDGRRVILVVFGLSSEEERASEAKRLIQTGFREFKRFDLFAAGETVIEAEVWNGEYDRVALVVPDALRVFMSGANRRKMKVVAAYEGPVPAPFAAGQRVGEVRVMVDNEVIATAPLVTGAPVDRAGLLSRIGTAVSQLLGGGSSSQPEAETVQ